MIPGEVLLVAEANCLARFDLGRQCVRAQAPVVRFSTAREVLDENTAFARNFFTYLRL